ncbi:ovostatin homolog [Rana temporaria]|uniref:ovostatin homolog n=1 Tax=Rana temporaria TaxID=8407 RepID=UPI001AAD84D1|nr:ovostatin homolog [Rana temporaria]
MSWRERRFLCALVLLLGFLARGRAEIQYVLSSPASLNSGETGKACVNIVGNKEKLDVSLILQHDGQNTSIIAEDVSSPTYFQCVEYKIPIVLEAVPVTLLLSAKGQETQVLERKPVVVKPSKNNCIFQMDKPIYQPGNKVFCRIVCMNSQLKPVNEKFPTIFLKDPSRTIIKQWTKPEMQRGVSEMNFNLIKDAPPGSYSFTAERESSAPLSLYFTVEEYVLPRFSLNVESPNSISVLQNVVNFTVAARYTYGEPVAGTVTTLSCKQPGLYGRRLNCFKEKGDPCSSMTGQLGPDGTYKGTIDMSGQFMGMTGMSMQMDIVVTEAETGIQVKNSRYIYVTTQPARLNLDYGAMNQYYKRGIPYGVVASLTDEQDNPIPNKDVEIEIDKKRIQTVKTDSAGKILYEIDTSDMVSPNFTVRISYKNPDQCYYAEWRDADYPSSERTVYRFYSKTGSFLQAKQPKEELSCGQNHNIEVQYTINQDGVKEKANTVTVYYLVMAKSKIVYNGQQDVDLTNSKNGSIAINLPVTSDMAPNINLVIYCILNGELLVETLSLSIEKCFKNKVDMAFSAEKGMPGSTVEVLLSASPDSICGLRVIDSSLLLLNSYERFSPENVHGLFSYGYYGGYNVGGFDVEGPEPQCLDPNKLVFFQGNYWLPASSDSEGDSYQNLRDVGLIVATGNHMRKPKVCEKNPPQESRYPVALNDALPQANLKFSAERSVGMGAGMGAGGASAIETVRTNFSDTFMWLMVPLDKEGHASLSEIAPDTITKWEGSAFCMSEKEGFGMTKYSANYTTFMPFFMELSHPQSIIRGEVMVIVGVVKNYLDYFIKVQAEMEPSASFTAEPREGTQNVCVPPKGQVSYTWHVKPNKLGTNTMTATAQTTFIGKSCDGPNDDSQPSRKDTVVPTFSVEPEGVAQELTLSNLVFMKPGLKSVLPVKITPPGNVVPDSISAYVTAVGDVFGLPWSNLQNMMAQPYGCAEQSLTAMASTITMLDYLNSTGQLTDETMEKGKQNILEAYYRHLAFANGPAYKVFRSSPHSDSWLTAVTFYTFEQAKKYVAIDKTRQQQSLIWLENTQKLENGCFKPQGRMLTTQDQDASITLTAYISIALQEFEDSFGKTLQEGAMTCLKNASTTEQTIGNEVLMLNAFTMAGLSEYSDPLMAKLMKKAIVKDGTIHWEREDMPLLRPVPFFFPIYAPAEVQLTSYMLLSMTERIRQLKGINLSDTGALSAQKDMSTMAQMAMWLVRQLNPRGAFSSTQDTAVALKALSSFAKLLYTPNSQHTIKVKGGNRDIGNLNLSPENRLVVQRQDLPEAHGEYSLEVEGNGWFLSQTTVKYNVPIPEGNTAFSLALSATSDKCVNGVTKVFNMTVTLGYQGSLQASDITIIKIRMLSGFNSDFWSLRELENAKTIAKSKDNGRGELEIYLQSVKKNEPITFTFRVLMGNRMLNVKKSSAMVYGFYEPGDNGYAEYEHPCVKNQ